MPCCRPAPCPAPAGRCLAGTLEAALAASCGRRRDDRLFMGFGRSATAQTLKHDACWFQAGHARRRAGAGRDRGTGGAIHRRGRCAGRAVRVRRYARRAGADRSKARSCMPSPGSKGRATSARRAGSSAPSSAQDSTIGPDCRIGGEVEASIVQGHSNKYHDGFLGHSYVGAWVNLAAATQTSDLRNDYDVVRVSVNGQRIVTGRTKIGAYIGDHAKTGLATLLNTGSTIGAFANVLPERVAVAGESSRRSAQVHLWPAAGTVGPAKTVQHRRTRHAAARRSAHRRPSRFLLQPIRYDVRRKAKNHPRPETSTSGCGEASEAAPAPRPLTKFDYSRFLPASA